MSNIYLSRKVFCIISAFLWLAPTGLLADGCFIAPTAFAKVQIPDQRALIHFANGTETLVIDTSFQGDGTNFAWIIPVPSRPTVEAATTGLFPTLQALFEPEIIHSVPQYFWWAVVVAVILSSFVWAKRRGVSKLTFILCWFFIFLMVSISLPAFVTAGVSTSPSGQVRVLERKTVGVYDTATLSSPDGGAVLDWLQKNGFATPTNLLPAIGAYAREGWFFVASKIRLDTPSSEPAKAHPLALTFKTEHPVYPLRLTGIGNEKCRIDLYVFGAEQATAPNFVVERCAVANYPTPDDNAVYRTHSTLRILHPLLRRLVDFSPVATKLTGQLTSEQMKQDAYITWSPFAEKRLTFYSAHGAALYALNIAISLVAIAMFVWYARVNGQSRWTNTLWKGSLLALGAFISWVIIYFALPKTPVTVATWPGMRMLMLHDVIPEELQTQARAAPAQGKPNLAWVRQQFREGLFLQEFMANDWAKAHGLSWPTNLFTDQLIHEEDSPGNYTLRQTADGIDYLWYDLDGGEHIDPLFGH